MKNINRTFPAFVLSLLVISFLVETCSVQKKLSSIKDMSLAASLSLSDIEKRVPELENVTISRDTFTVEDEKGNEMIIMKAIKDDETGDMVANETLEAAVVTARFRNVAERAGKVDLCFQVIVPESLQDSKWQLRFFPDLFVLQDSVRLDSVIITGSIYRKSQIRGYQHYERFLAGMMSDSTMFTNLVQLELFLKRNIPQIYAFKNDTTLLTEDEFYSAFGVNEQEAMEHYDRRNAKKAKMYKRFVKSPMIVDGIRLDTVMRSIDGKFVYNYIQTIEARPKLKKADIVLSGKIYEQGQQIYSMPKSEPISFYISSISAFLDNTTHYKTKVIERRAEANSSCKIDFEVGKTEIKSEIGDNALRICEIKERLSSLLENETYDLDSIVVTATASPEGSYETNRLLAQRRSESVSSYFNSYVKHYSDSLVHEQGYIINMDGSAEMEMKNAPPSIRFIPYSIPENWDDLKSLVEKDSVLTERQKESFEKIFKTSNPDAREVALRKTDYYNYVKSNLYPELRTVKFNFYQHRKGMVKDTVHTEVVDSLYMEGIQALRDMDYDKALEIFRPYNDYNTAVVYTALGRNASAMQILERMVRNAEINYLMAIIHSRNGDDKNAVECYLRACQQNPSFVYRGNLDPEISALINKYALNQEDDLDDYL